MGRKTNIRSFQELNRWIYTREELTLNMATKAKLPGEIESLRIAAQNNAIRTNYIKVKIDYTPEQQSLQFYRFSFFC